MNADGAKSLLQQVLTFLDTVTPPVTREGAPDHSPAVRTHAFLLAVVADEPLPVQLLRPWSSAKQFYRWHRTGRLTLQKKNRKLCVKPSVFFKFWRELPDDKKPAA